MVNGRAMVGVVVAYILAAVSLVAAAPAPTPTPSPRGSPSPRPRLFERGPQFVVIGAAISPRVDSEFTAGALSARTSFEGWLGSESTIVGKIHVFSFTDYRSFSYDHLGADPVATIEGAGSAIVGSFGVRDDQLESGGGIRIAPRLFVGASMMKRQESTGYPPLKGIGYTLMFAPSAGAAITPYGWITYEPNLGGIYQLPDGSHTALTYRGMRYRLGALMTQPHSRLFLDLGFAGENLINRTNAPSGASDSMVTIGFGTKF
jgi:hypothetical protein